MAHNPYQSPQPTGDQTPREGNPVGLFEIVMGAVPVVTVAAATFHSLQQADRVAYLNWPLIYFELLGIFGAFFVGLVSSIRAIFFFKSSRVWKGTVNALLAMLAVMAAFAAIFIDAPTMIYAT